MKSSDKRKTWNIHFLNALVTLRTVSWSPSDIDQILYVSCITMLCASVVSPTQLRFNIHM